MNKDFVTFPTINNCKFCLVGSGKILTVFANMLIERGFPSPILVTWKKKFHERDIKLLSDNENYINIFEFAFFVPFVHTFLVMLCNEMLQIIRFC